MEGLGTWGSWSYHTCREKSKSSGCMRLASPILLLDNPSLFYNFRVGEISPKPQPQGHSIDLHQSEQCPDFLPLLFIPPLSRDNLSLPSLQSGLGKLHGRRHGTPLAELVPLESNGIRSQVAQIFDFSPWKLLTLPSGFVFWRLPCWHCGVFPGPKMWGVGFVCQSHGEFGAKWF